MVRPLTEQEIIERVVEIVKKHLPECRLYLFGSRARGTAKETSDFDFAVECEGRVPFYKMALIIDEAEELPTLKSFDFVDLKITSPTFAQTVKKEGILLYDGLSEREVKNP